MCGHSTATMATSTLARPLRISVYPYIPDLAEDKLDGLKEYIASTFEKSTGIKSEVKSDVNPYDLDSLKSKYLSSSAESYDIVELDTILLGELAKSGHAKKLDDIFDIDHLDCLKKPLFSWCIHSATVGGSMYGVPTLQCANFLSELVTDGYCTPKKPLLKDWQSFEELKQAIDSQEKGSHRLLLAGDFRGSWGLPMFYLDAYVDKHGKDSVDQGIREPVVDSEIIEDMKEFTDYGRVGGKNPDTDGEFHEHHNALISEVVDSQHILMYSYSENLAEVLYSALKKNQPKIALKIVSAPLESSNYLITYTDALVVNNFCDTKRENDIKKFVEFYTSLDFRTAVAFGRDLPKRLSIPFPRYVLPARQDFFLKTEVQGDNYYQMFHRALEKHSIPAPNHDIYEKRVEMEKSLQKLLGMKMHAKTQLKPIH